MEQNQRIQNINMPTIPVNGEQMQYLESVHRHYASTKPSFLYAHLPQYLISFKFHKWKNTSGNTSKVHKPKSRAPAWTHALATSRQRLQLKLSWIRRFDNLCLQNMLKIITINSNNNNNNNNLQQKGEWIETNKSAEVLQR